MEHDIQPKKNRNMKRTGVLIVFISALIVLGIIAIGVYWAMTNGTKGEVVERQTVARDGNVIESDLESVIADVAERVSPSVVSIVTNVTQQSLFGAVQAEAAGTGVIVSKDGLVLTNKHVISNASSVAVVLSNGKRYDNVEIVGSDPLNDIAYLQIAGVHDLPPVELGDSSTLRVGQQVVAIGNSLGQYQNTVTSGIISGKGRPVTAGNSSGGSTETLTDLLQTDAAINPGNSGGPLLNRTGQVIGINTAVAANAEGIGFAIPINATKGTLKSVLAGKGVQRAYIGLRYVPLTPEVANEYNLDTTLKGAYVIGSQNFAAIEAGGPADEAGIREKDIITKINGLVVGVQGGVSSLIGEYSPGDTITVTILRNGREIERKITLETYR